MICLCLMIVLCIILNVAKIFFVADDTPRCTLGRFIGNGHPTVDNLSLVKKKGV